jgi:hypothetical protein
MNEIQKIMITLQCATFGHRYNLKSCAVCSAPDELGVKQSQPYGSAALRVNNEHYPITGISPALVLRGNEAQF